MTAAYLAYLIRLHSARLVFVFGANTNNYLYLYVTLVGQHESVGSHLVVKNAPLKRGKSSFRELVLPEKLPEPSL